MIRSLHLQHKLFIQVMSIQNLSEADIHPKRTQEIATILCHTHLLDGDVELSRKIVGHIKDLETEWQRVWHIHHLRLWHGSMCARRAFPEYKVTNWRSDFRVDDVVQEVDLQRILLLTELTVRSCVGVLRLEDECGQVQDGLRYLRSSGRGWV